MVCAYSVTFSVMVVKCGILNKVFRFLIFCLLKLWFIEINKLTCVGGGYYKHKYFLTFQVKDCFVV